MKTRSPGRRVSPTGPPPSGRKPYQDPKAPKGRPPEPPKPTRTERENAWQEGQKEGAQKVERAKDAVDSGDKQKIRDSAIEMQGDKQGLYEINRQTSPEAIKTRQALKENLKEAYKETDKATCDELSKQNDGAKVREKPITNAPRPGAKPKDPTKSSYDRDVTFEREAKPGELIPDPKEPGKFTKAKGGEWVDIPPEKSAPVYNKNFKESLLKGASPETQNKYKDMHPDEFAHKMDQTVTDRMSNDAYGRGQSDLQTATQDPTGNFSDPSGIGKTVEFKGNEWFHKESSSPAEHESNVAEGMRQSTKQYDNLVNARLHAINENRAAEGKPPMEPPPKLAESIKIMEKVDAGKISPAEAEHQLAQMGKTKEDITHDLGDYVKTVLQHTGEEMSAYVFIELPARAAGMG